MNAQRDRQVEPAWSESMIDIECDNCEKTFEVSDDQAGGKVACPMCGDINRVPDAPRARPAPAAGGDPGLFGMWIS